MTGLAHYSRTRSATSLRKTLYLYFVGAFKVTSPCVAEVSEPRRSGYVASSRFGTAFRFQSVRVTLKVLTSDSRVAATIEKHIAIFLAKQINPTPFSPHK